MIFAELEMEPVTGKLGLDIFLWICLAVAAGFFGYLGRRLMERLLTRRNARKSAAALEAAKGTPPETPDVQIEQIRLKAEKKKAKAEAKRAKKAAKG